MPLHPSPSLALAALLLAGAATAGPAAAQAAPPPDAREQAARAADALLARERPALGAGARDAFARRAVQLDPDGAAHVRYDRTSGGLPVLGGDLVVHVTRGRALAGLSRTLAQPVEVDAAPAVPAGRAQQVAEDRARTDARTVTGVGTRLVVDAVTGRPALAQEVVLAGVQQDATPSRYHVLVDARTGQVRRAWDEVQTGTGRSLYSGSVPLSSTRTATGGYELRDGTRGGGTITDLRGATTGTGTLFTDTDDLWGSGTTTDRASAAVDAAYGAQKTYDFYATLGRSGIYGNGTGVRSRVHYGNGYANAFWDGTQMTYGDGTSNARPLVSLDVAAHEMTHGVTENTAGLTYSGESGGLNEATSDILAAAVEFSAASATDVGDYLVGERLGTPFRYMDRPSRDGRSPDCWASGLGTLDVHLASGPANHAFYLLAEGSGAKTINGVSYNSPTCNGATVTGIGRDAATRIWYRALSTYMTSSTSYAGARTAAVRAATDLYGATSPQCAGVVQAFAGISVPGTTCGTTAPTGGALVNPGFESGPTGWSATAGVITDDAAQAHSGAWEAWLGGYGSTHTDTMQQTVTVPSTSTAALSFWLRIATDEAGTAAYDTLRLQVVSGTTTTTLATWSNAQAGGWVQRSASLSAYAGRSVTLRWTGTEDAAVPTSFLVDDVALRS